MNARGLAALVTVALSLVVGCGAPTEEETEVSTSAVVAPGRPDRVLIVALTYQPSATDAVPADGRYFVEGAERLKRYYETRIDEVATKSDFEKKLADIVDNARWSAPLPPLDPSTAKKTAVELWKVSYAEELLERLRGYAGLPFDRVVFFGHGTFKTVERGEWDPAIPLGPQFCAYRHAAGASVTCQWRGIGTANDGTTPNATMMQDASAMAITEDRQDHLESLGQALRAVTTSEAIIHLGICQGGRKAANLAPASQEFYPGVGSWADALACTSGRKVTSQTSKTSAHDVNRRVVALELGIEVGNSLSIPAEVDAAHAKGVARAGRPVPRIACAK